MNITVGVTDNAWAELLRARPDLYEVNFWVPSERSFMGRARPDEPFLFKTSDFGQTWTRIDGGLPRTHPLDYVLAVAENPNRRGMIFAGTGHAFFYSRDDGKTWTQFMGMVLTRKS